VPHRVINRYSGHEIWNRLNDSRRRRSPGARECTPWVVHAFADIAPAAPALKVARDALDAGGVCADARIVPGAVAPTAILVPEAADALVGRKLDETALAGLDQAARHACKPIDDKRGTIEYRTKVAGVLVRRTATIAYERAGERR
jgi:CO/xanthine dehydrogenase FAD-binding subunit